MSTLRSVYTNLVAARTTVRDVRRLDQIARVFARHGFGFLFSRLSGKDAAVARAVEEALEETGGAEAAPSAQGQALAIRFREAIEDLGPTFIKFGQILSTRPDLIPAVFCDELQGLQDDVEPMGLDDVKSVIREELGRDPDQVFAAFDEAPLAAASIAQVHRARLEGGEAVAVKVQRPGIGATIEADLDILYWLARQLVAVAPETRLFDPAGIVREFEKAIRKELDFAAEARHMERFARNFRDVDYVHIPTVHKPLSTSKVLTMEFIDGVKITDAVTQGLGDGEVLAKRALHSLFKQFFKDGFFHGDLHPGNILVVPGNRLVYLDFGLVGRLTPDMKDRVVDLLFAVARRDFDAMARVLFDIGEREGAVDYDAFVADVYDVGERYFDETPLSEVDMGGLFRELVQGAMRHHMHMPATYTMVFKSLVTVEGLGKRIAPEMDIIAEAQPFIAELLKERYAPERLLKRANEMGHTLGRLMRQVPPALTRVLEDVDAGRLTFQIDFRRLDDYLEDRRRSDTMWGLGAVYGILTLAATLALSWNEVTILGIPAISFVGYALSVPVGAMFLRAWWRR